MSVSKDGAEVMTDAVPIPHNINKPTIILENSSADDKDDDSNRLHLACRDGKISMVKQLLDKGVVNIKDEDKDGFDAFTVAIHHGHLNIIQLFIERGYDINEKLSDDRTCLHHAINAGHLPIIKFLIDQNADIHQKTPRGANSLHIASRTNDQNAIILLLAKGANIHEKNDSGETCLHVASRCGNKTLVQFLMEKGCRIDVRDNQGHWPFDVTEDQEIRDILENLPIHGAVMNGDLVKVQDLVKRNFNTTNRSGTTAIEVAVMYGQLDILKYLLDEDLNEEKYSRPIQVAIEHGNAKLVKFLYEKQGHENWEMVYLERVESVGIEKILYKQLQTPEIEEFLGNLLLLSSKYDVTNLVTEISNLILNYKSVPLINWRRKHKVEQTTIEFKEMVSKIIHFVDEDGKTPLYFIHQNNNLKTGLELLYNEKQAHRNRTEALKCIRSKAGSFRMDAWLIDTYKAVHPKTGCGSNTSAFVAVVLQVFLSICFVGLDFISDIFMCVDYWYKAYDTKNALNDTMCPVENYETCLSNEIWLNISMNSNENLPLLFKMAENVNCTFSRKWISCIDIDIENTQGLYEPAFYIMLFTILISLVSYLWITCKTKIVEEGNIFKKIFLKIIWPFIYLIKEFKLRKDPNLKLADSLKDIESSWKLLKAVENGIENYIQFFVQLFLLAPYISFLLSLPIKDLLWMGISNLIGIFNPNETICGGNGGYSALGKLFLSVLSLSYGTASRQTTRRGQTLSQTFKNLVLWLSFVLLSLARVISIFSLLALNKPFLSSFVFVSIHTALVLVILVITKELKVTSELFPCILTSIASHTVLINIHNVKRKTNTFKKQLLFHSLVMIENFILLLIPLMSSDNNPSTDCYKTTSSEVYKALSLWLTGIVLLVIYYKFLHPMSDVNGPKLSQYILCKKSCKQDIENELDESDGTSKETDLFLNHTEDNDIYQMQDLNKA